MYFLLNFTGLPIDNPSRLITPDIRYKTRLEEKALERILMIAIRNLTTEKRRSPQKKSGWTEMKPCWTRMTSEMIVSN